MGIGVNLSELDATAQAELVRRREVSALELVDAAIANIERLDGSLNAVIHRRFEKARAEAVTREDGVSGLASWPPRLEASRTCIKSVAVR